MNKIRTETSTQNKECGSRSVGEIMAAVVPEDLEMGVVLSVVMEEVPARSEEAEVLGETGVVQGVVVEEVPACSEAAEVLGEMGVVQGVVAGEGIKAAAKLQASIQGQQERKNPTKPPAKTAKEGDAAEPDCGGCTFSVGEKVTGDWKGQGQLFPATVRAVHAADHSYDLAYDDRRAPCSESRVPARLVRPLPERYSNFRGGFPESDFKFYALLIPRLLLFTFVVVPIMVVLSAGSCVCIPCVYLSELP